MLDGATGQVVGRVSLAPETYRNDCALSEKEPLTVGPIVGADGAAYVLARRSDRVASGPCNESTVVSDDKSWTVLRLPRTGAVTSVVVDACDLSCSLITPQQLLPDGTGGLVLNVKRYLGSSLPDEQRVIRFDAEWVRNDLVTPSYSRIDLVGQSGTVYLQKLNGATQEETRAVNIFTGATLWAVSPGYTSLVAAHPDNGAAAQGSAGELFRIDAIGQRAETMFTTQVVDPVQFKGNWVGNGTATVKGVAGDFPDATRSNATRASVSPGYYEPRASGDEFGASAQRNPGRGIFLKSHDALFASTLAQHVSIRVAPENQAWLLYDRADLIGGTDQYGNAYFTLGAGTADGDTSPSCTGVLINGKNRPADVNLLNKRVSSELPIAKDFISQGAAIIQLLSAHDRYLNNAAYYCFPEMAPSAYNSNSYAHGLLHAASLPHAETAPGWRPTPGWETPVPANYFP